MLLGVASAYQKWIERSGQQWARERSRVWSALVRRALQVAPPPGIFADIGAGTGGLAAAAARARYQAAAVDAALPPEGPYVRASGSMAALPFGDGALRVAAFSASLHYAEDFGEALREARRALSPEGVLFVALSPVHGTRESADGSAGTTQEEIEKAGGTGDVLLAYRHLVEAELRAGLEAAGFSFEIRPSGFSIPFRLQRWMKRLLLGDRLARFPFVVARPRA